MVRRSINQAIVLAASAVCASSQDPSTVSDTCGLVSCYNGGKCVNIEFTTHGTDVELNTNVQQESRAEAAGQLLTFCRCPTGFTGFSCDIPHDNICTEAEAMCRSGHQCTPNTLDDTVYECPCDVAYSVSTFAGMMCQNPATEYCDQWNHELGHQHFCTNGGVCKNGLTAAAGAGDGWAQDDGGEGDSCICPPDFDGPRCENLKGFGVPPNQARGGERSVEARVGTTMFLVMIISAAVFGLALVAKRYVVGTHVDPTGQDDSSVPRDLQLDCNISRDGSDEPKLQGHINDDSPTSVSIAPHDRSANGTGEAPYNTFDIDQIVQVQEDIHEDKFV